VHQLLRRESGRQNPEREFARDPVSRLSIAFAAFVILGLLTYMTISDQRIRMVTFAILALFAVKTWLHRNDPREPDGRDDGVK
jgi:hypothetical protein